MRWPSDAELASKTTAELRRAYPHLIGQQIQDRRKRRSVSLDPQAAGRANAARGIKNPLPLEQVEYEEDLPDPTTPQAFEELWRAVAGVKAVEKKYDPRRHKIGLKLPGNRPVGLVFSGDWQLGSEGVDYELWKDDMDALMAYRKRDQEGLYGIGMGDYQSALSTLNIRGSQHRDVLRAGDQFRLCKGLFHLSKGFWLILLTGCHDTFTTRAGDIDPVEEYCRISGARHGWHGVEAAVQFGAERYLLRLRHRYRFNSSLNPLNSQRRQAEMEGPADVIAHAHFHTSLTGEMPAAGQDAVMLRSGSYQIHDDFARQAVGNVKADPRFPMVIIWPGKHKIWSIRDFKEGLDYLASLRRRS